MNLTFCSAQPASIVDNYWYDFPVSQQVGRLKVKVRDGFLQVGAYKINLRNLDHSFTIGHFGGAAGAMMPIEAVWTPTHDGLTGTYRIGGWYDSSRGNDFVLDTNGGLAALTGGTPVQRHGRWGTWFVARQQLTGGAKDRKATRGRTLFARGAQADKRTATTDNQLTIGLFYEGVDGMGKNDAIGFVLGRTHVNARVTQAERVEPDKAVLHSEYVGEMFYSLHPASGVGLRPKLQYIADPGGVRRASSSVVLGLKAMVTL